jgi:thymidine phosphorylase
VGDKITLPLVPLVAAFGVRVPQLSGRGLGHTGGTLDKMESIPGWRANLSNEEMFTILREVGGVICAAGSGLAPADKKLYALRDTTATVDCIPLIASSIMSKKIAEGTGALVLDVKTGAGAFMSDESRARELARTMVDLGTDAGLTTIALLTDMSTPLGLTVGNALEVRESVEVLAGGGPADVIELTSRWPGRCSPRRAAGRRRRGRRWPTGAPWMCGVAWSPPRAGIRTPHCRCCRYAVPG